MGAAVIVAGVIHWLQAQAFKQAAALSGATGVVDMGLFEAGRLVNHIFDRHLRSLPTLGNQRVAPSQYLGFDPGHRLWAKGYLGGEGAGSDAAVNLGRGKASVVLNLGQFDEAAGELVGVGMCGHVVRLFGWCWEHGYKIRVGLRLLCGVKLRIYPRLIFLRLPGFAFLVFHKLFKQARLFFFVFRKAGLYIFLFSLALYSEPLKVTADC